MVDRAPRLPGDSAGASFRARFDVLVEALLDHPQIEVFDAIVRPPASEAALCEAEAALGARLPADIRGFYEAHDGVFLEWGLRGRRYRNTAPFGYPDDRHPPGCINLVPVSEAMSPGWEADSHVNTIGLRQQTLLFGGPLEPPPPVQVVCVDNYARFHHGDLVLGPTPMMVVSSDYGADMDSSDFTSFAVYLDVTLAIFGVDRFNYGLGHRIGQSRTPTYVPRWSKSLALDELVATLTADADRKRA